MINWEQNTEFLWFGTIDLDSDSYEVCAEYDPDCDQYVGWVTDMDESFFDMMGLNDDEFVDHVINLIKQRWLE